MKAPLGGMSHNQRIVWDAIEDRIDKADNEGISAMGEINPNVAAMQTRFIDGMRAARLAAIAALGEKK